MIIQNYLSPMFNQFTFAFLCFRFSPEKIWYIDQMLKVLAEVKMLMSSLPLQFCCLFEPCLGHFSMFIHYMIIFMALRCFLLSHCGAARWTFSCLPFISHSIENAGSFSLSHIFFYSHHPCSCLVAILVRHFQLGW